MLAAQAKQFSAVQLEVDASELILVLQSETLSEDLIIELSDLELKRQLRRVRLRLPKVKDLRRKTQVCEPPLRLRLRLVLNT